MTPLSDITPDPEDRMATDETAAVNPHAAYAAEQRRKLDVLIAGLRADGWDVVARRERDLAWAERDEARDEAERLRDALCLHQEGRRGLPNPGDATTRDRP